MSEENKDQVQQEPQAQEEKQELILGKFKTQDDLIDSYKSLERKLHDRRPDNDEGAKPPKDSSSNKEEFEWQKKSAQLDAKDELLAARKQEAAAVLNDSDTLGAVRRALGDSTAIEQFTKEFHAGHVSASEVKRLASLGGHKTESTKTIPESTTPSQTSVSEAEQKYWLDMVSNHASAYHNSKHPKYAEVREKIADIKLRASKAA